MKEFDEYKAAVVEYQRAADAHEKAKTFAAGADAAVTEAERAMNVALSAREKARVKLNEAIRKAAP